MDKLQLTGQNLVPVFNSKHDCMYPTKLWWFEAKLPNLKLQKQLGCEQRFAALKILCALDDMCVEVCWHRSLIFIIKAKWWKTEKVLSYKTNLRGDFDTWHKDITYIDNQHYNKNVTININGIGNDHNEYNISEPPVLLFW